MDGYARGVKRIDTFIEYDVEADAAYVYVTKIGAGEAVEQVVLEDDQLPGGELIIDLDNQGRLLGFELLSASTALPSKLLEELA